ncbi:MAG: Hpt domain-containing protein, partial [Methylovulum sp.]|nr:Hpt domain-containing protein [Methylovulum sp.]
TAAAMQHDRAACLAAGMNDHLSKPFNSRQLIDTLVRWIKPGQGGPSVAIQPPLFAAGALHGDTFFVDADVCKAVGGGQLATPPGFNFTNILSMLGGDVGQLLQVLAMFSDDYANIAQDIAANITQGEWVLAESQAHQLKGVAGNVGAAQLHQISQTLDGQLKQQRCDPELLGQWRDCVAYTLQTIGTILTRHPLVEICDGEDQHRCQQLALILDGFLAQRDFISNGFLAEFKAAISLQQREDYNDLERSIKKLDYANARRILARFAPPP